MGNQGARVVGVAIRRRWREAQRLFEMLLGENVLLGRVFGACRLKIATSSSLVTRPRRVRRADEKEYLTNFDNEKKL